MTKQNWIIGSNTTCDIVVASTTVSGQHCRLSLDDSELTLTDLGSTNGTYVNGNRVSGTVTITMTDRVTVGQTEPMPWPDSGLPEPVESVASNESADSGNDQISPRRLISIGRSPNNSVVLDGTNVSGNHARLILANDDIVVEDLGSTNGTAVHDVENKIIRASVKLDDFVYFGSTAYRVRELITLAEESTLIVVPENDSRTQASKSQFADHRIALFTASVILCLAAVGWMTFWGGKTPNPVPQAANSTAAGVRVANVDALQEASRRNSSLADQTRKESVSDIESVPTTVSPASEAKLTADEELARSIFLIVCADPQHQTPFRVGTGFAIDTNRVATSASVIDAIGELNRNGFPVSFLYSPSTDEKLALRSMITHTQYAAANAEARAAQHEHDKIFDQLETEPPTPETFEAVKSQLIAARLKAVEAIEQKTAFDVGVIEVDGPLLHWISAPEHQKRLRPNQKLSVTGYAFDIQDPFLDTSSPFELSEMESRVRQISTASDDTAGRLLASASADQTEYAFLGCPIVNVYGKVVAIYSRSSPASDEQPDSEPPMYDAALFQRIGECNHEGRQ